LVAWIGSLALGFIGLKLGIIPHLFYVFIPVWFLTAMIYLLLAPLAGARESLSDPATVALSVDSVTPLNELKPFNTAAPPEKSLVYYVFGIVALAALVLCVVLPINLFLAEPEGHLARLEAFKAQLLWISLVYFVSSTIWLTEYERRN
jgi:hypothetical protein